MLHHLPKITELIYGKVKYITLPLVLFIIWRIKQSVLQDSFLHPLFTLNHNKRQTHTSRTDSRKGYLLFSHISQSIKENKWLNKQQEGFRFDINWVAGFGEALEKITKGYFEIIQLLKNTMDWIPTQNMPEGTGSNSMNLLLIFESRG